MANCKVVNIWIDANHKETFSIFPNPPHYVPIPYLDADHLRSALLPFNQDNSVQVTISTPLREGVGPLRGDCDGFTQPSVRLWKRGSGNRFKPLRPGSIQCLPVYGSIDTGTTGGCRYPKSPCLRSWRDRKYLSWISHI
ncbi:hypothetical protein F4819DRAFT_189877 [Hypoxylon fuscum]|nr:hypothetical protein F4819DRAFT_189877 [Hypoxylon fuscum]